MTGVKETACTRCVHRDVCMYKNNFLEAQRCLDRINFIIPVELSCRYRHNETINGQEIIFDKE